MTQIRKPLYVLLPESTADQLREIMRATGYTKTQAIVFAIAYFHAAEGRRIRSGSIGDGASEEFCAMLNRDAAWLGLADPQDRIDIAAMQNNGKEYRTDSNDGATLYKFIDQGKEVFVVSDPNTPDQLFTSYTRETWAKHTHKRR